MSTVQQQAQDLVMEVARMIRAGRSVEEVRPVVEKALGRLPAWSTETMLDRVRYVVKGTHRRQYKLDQIMSLSAADHAEHLRADILAAIESEVQMEAAQRPATKHAEVVRQENE